MSSVATKPPPKGWPRMSASVVYTNAREAIAFLEKAFGFELELKVEDPGGRIAHSQLLLGGGLLMLGDPAGTRPWRKSPKEAGGVNTTTLCFYVDDVDAHCERARAAGATIFSEPTTADYGPDYWADRTYEAVDHEGHHWYFMQRVRG